MLNIRKKILIADDDPIICDALRLILEQTYEIEIAHDGLQALEQLDLFKPDLLLLDIFMPKKDGIEVLETVRNSKEDPAVVMITGARSRDTTERAHALGIEGMLLKPFQEKELWPTVVRALSFERHSYCAWDPIDSHLDPIVNPKSVAIIGASEVRGKASERRTRSLIEGGYQGDLYLINRKRKKVFGKTAYPSIKDIETEIIDLAVIITAPQHLSQAVEETCQKGTRGILIITASKDKELQRKISDTTARFGTRLVGPNCSGIYNGKLKLDLLGIPGLKKGPLGVISQSGNVIDSLSYYSEIKGVGFSKIISAGNAIDLNACDYIEFLANDPETEAIMLYLESIGNGQRFLEVARRTSRRKPIIALKVGGSEAGRRAAASHTGALAADDSMVEAAFRQAGIICAKNVDEMFFLASALVKCPLPGGKRVAILSEGGGDNAIAADNAQRYGLEVPIFSKVTQKKLQPILLEDMTAENPIDYGGVAEEDPEKIVECCKVCMESGEIDSIYVTGFFGGFQNIISENVGSKEVKASKQLLKLVEEYQIPIVMHSSFSRTGAKALELLKVGSVPVFESSERAAHALESINQYARNRDSLNNAQQTTFASGPKANVNKIISDALAKYRGHLLETEACQVLHDYSIELLPQEVVSSQKEAVEVAKNMGLPVALKILSPQIVHKSDVGGVRVELHTPQAVRTAYSDIIKSVKKNVPEADIEGILVSPMAPPGQECIIGAIRDKVFGPVLMFGLGGIYVETLKDISFRILPLYNGDMHEMMEETKVYSLLKGARGKIPADIEAIRNTLRRVADLIVSNTSIREIEMNPVIGHAKGCTVVDARIILSDPDKVGKHIR